MTSLHPVFDTSKLAGSGTALFVRRPILAFVLNALIVLAGLAGLSGVEIRELPNVDSPIVTIVTNFSGAAPETIDREVTAVIETAAGRVAGVKSISSSSRFGASRVTVEFRDGVNLDVGATDLRDAVARVASSLPDGADDPRIVKADANAAAIMRIALTSPTRSAQALTIIMKDLIEDKLLSVSGVADLQIYGDREQFFLVDVDQMQLAARGLTLADLQNALRNVTFDAPSGALGSERQSLLVRTTAAITTASQFEALEIAANVRLGDVAQVTLGPESGASILRANGQNGVGIGIIRQAQGNTLDVSRAVTNAVAELQAVVPGDVRIFVTSDTATFITGAIHEVVIALVLSVLSVT